jgi:hypothetical protein
MDSLPYVYNDHHVPSTPQTTPLTAPWAISCTLSSSTLAERPLAASTEHTHRLPPPRLSTTAGNCFPSRTARSVLRPIHRVPACVPRVFLRGTYAPAPSYVGRRTRRTRCRCRGVRAEREDGVRELVVQRVAGRHAQRGHRHTACSQGSVRAPPAPHRAFSLAHVVSAGGSPRADASLRAAIHVA